MRTLRIETSLLCLLSLTAAACTVSHGTYTKEQARELSGVTPEGDDICAMEAWYGDGVCDEFCPEADEDCVTCFAIPSCEDWEIPHASASDCPSDSSCREVSLCGETIWCQDTATCAAYPSCGPGETLYENESECPSDTVCYPSSICGATVWCSEGASCDGIPVCEEGEIEHATRESCPGEECREVSHCGTTIWCSPGATCLAFPSCGEGETAYESASECPADAGCRAVSVCGSTIWCSDAAVCEGPSPAGCPRPRLRGWLPLRHDHGRKAKCL